jgi:hypothetical protein
MLTNQGVYRVSLASYNICFIEKYSESVFFNSSISGPRGFNKFKYLAYVSTSPNSSAFVAKFSNLFLTDSMYPL